MKKRLLSLFSVAFTAVAANAQSWAEPTLTLTTDTVPEKAYIYNVEQGKFLTKGGAWGNHACIKSDVTSAFLYEMQLQDEENTYKLHCSAAANNGMLGRQSIEDVYTDWKAQADWGLTWEFIPVTGGYNIRTAASDPHYGSNKYTEDDPADYGVYLLGWSENRDDLTNGDGEPMGTNDGIYMVDPSDMEGWSITWAFMTPESYEVYNAQWSLYNKLNEAFEMGYTEAELSSYAATLKGNDVEAIAAARAEVDKLILNYAYNHATPQNPFDVTSKINNPTFEGARGAEPEGWVDEFGNMTIQNNKAYPVWDEETGAVSSEYGLNNFSQNWTASATEPIAKSNIYQVINDLPQGTYFLQADAIATSASASLEVSGAELYAESGAVRYAQAIDKNPYGEAGSGDPHRYQLLITHMGGDLKIGYGFNPGYVKWFAVDNFKLFYAGPVSNPGLVALQGTLEVVQPYIDYYTQDAAHYYSEATKDLLDSEITKANAVLGGSSDDCQNAATALNELLKTVKAEVTAYGKLAKFVEQVNGDMAKYPFIDDLGDKYDTYKGAYEDKNATIEQIDAWVNGYADYIKAGIIAALPSASAENPIELTGLFVNLGFEENSAESKTPTNWTANSDAFKARANTAEVWNAAFDAYTTLSDLPVGAYRIVAHGMSRSGGNADNYAAEGANVTAELYANNSSVKLVSQHVGASAEKLYSNDVNLTEDEENPLWIPNSMEGARVYFNVAETPYVNTVTANLLNEGDLLRIGVRDNGLDGSVPTDSWTIWSDIRVYYIGVNANALYNEMVNIVASTESMMENCQVAMAISKLQSAVSVAEKLSESSSEEDIKAAISGLNEAIEYYNEGKSLVQKVMAIQGVYEKVLEDYDVAGTDLVKIVDAMGVAVANEEFDSNEVINGWLNGLPAARTAHIYASVVIEGGLTPSLAEPVDISAVMTNPSFDEGENSRSGATGWTIDWAADHIGWNNEAQQSGSNNAYEYWKATKFDMYQEVVGLPEGFYRVSCQGLYRPGNNTDEVAAIYAADPANARDMAFYVNDKSVALTSIYDFAQEEAVGADGEASCTLDGKTVYVPNTMISAAAYFEAGYYTNTIDIEVKKGDSIKIGLKLAGNVVDANWCVFDNFKIQALGATAPTAIENVLAGGQASQAIYDLSGRKVSKAVKGIYIMNGKKVVR